MNVIRASLSAVAIALVLGCANCGNKPAEDTPEDAAAAVGPTIQITVEVTDLAAASIEKLFVTPVERTLKQGKNIAHIWSHSTATGAELEVTFDADTDEATAMSAAQAAAEKIAMRGRGTIGTPKVTVDSDDEPLRLKLSGTDIEAMHAVALAVAEEVKGLDGVKDATSSMGLTPNVEISLDNDKLKEAGLRPMSISAQLAKPEIQESTDVDAILATPIDVADGKTIPLGDIATVQLTQVPTRLDRLDGNRVAWVSIDAAADDDALRVALKGINSPNPAIRVSVED